MLYLVCTKPFCFKCDVVRSVISYMARSKRCVKQYRPICKNKPRLNTNSARNIALRSFKIKTKLIQRQGEMLT